MFIDLFSSQFLIVLASFLIFGIFAWEKPDWAPAAVLFIAPVYLLKTRIAWLPLNFLEILIWETAVIWLIKKIGQNDFGWPAIKKEFCFWPMIWIISGAILATLISPDLKTSAGILKSWFIEPLILALIIFDLAKTREIFKRYLLAMIFSGAAVALISVFYLISGRLTFDGRLQSFYSSPNFLAMDLAPALILAFLFWFGLKNKKLKVVFAICYLLFAICLYATFSYAAWLAIFIPLIFLLFFLRRAKIINSKKLFTIICLLLIIFLAAIFSQINSVKMDNLLHSDRSSFESRLAVWQTALKIGQDHWFLGIGPGMFQKYYLEYQKYFPSYLEWAVPQPQNIFLAFWLQTGLLGLISFGWLVFLLIKRNLTLFTKTKQPLILALAAVFVYILIHGLADTTFWKNDLALIFFALTALSCKAGRLFG